MAPQTEMKEPRVSVLIPLYNCEKYIGSAIESVLAQTYTDYEIIVADDGSTDGGGQIVLSFPGVRFFPRAHEGIPRTRNFLISEARGELVAFLDADDAWTPDKLEKQVACFDADPGCDIVFCRYQNFTELPEEELSASQRKLLRTEIDRPLTTACMRKSLFERFGLFDPGCAYAEDTELTARFIMGGVDVTKKLDEVLYLRRVHTGNITLTHNESGNRAFYASLAGSIRDRLYKGKKEG